MTAFALSLAYIGTLVFVAWLYHARTIERGRRWRSESLAAVDRRVMELERVVAQVEARADPADLLKRIQALETANTRRAFGG